MSKVTKVIEVLAQSEKSWEDAAQNALTEASKSIRNIKSIYIKDKSAKVVDNKISQYRITAKISFRVDEEKKK
ncbi:MAG: dodecin family protein [Sulfurovaceae bacterium]|jgi:flavin-binding protein dodecin|nr:dodecin family protein [Sulfurovaceae bacterium]